MYNIFLWRALALMLCAVVAPLQAMDKRKKQKIDGPGEEAVVASHGVSLDIKRLKKGIYGVIASCDETSDELYIRGIESIKANQGTLKDISFQQLQLFPSFEPQFLKILTIKCEYTLLSDFIEMHHRSYPEQENGINFLYTTENSLKGNENPGRTLVRVKQYTLLDVAHAAYVVARAENKPAGTEYRIMRLLVEQGGETFENLSKPKWPLGLPIDSNLSADNE